MKILSEKTFFLGAILVVPLYLMGILNNKKSLFVAGLPVIGIPIALFSLIINFATGKLQDQLSMIASIGCGNPVELRNGSKKIGAGVKVNALLLKYVPGLAEHIKTYNYDNNMSNTENYMSFLESQHKMNKREKRLIDDLLNGGNNKEFEKNFTKITKEVNGCDITIQIPKSDNIEGVEPIGNAMNDVMEETLDENNPDRMVCCDDDYLKVISENIQSLLNSSDIKSFLEKKENKLISLVLNLVVMSFDNEKIKQLMYNYEHSGLYKKIFGTGLYGPFAKYFRIFFCNIMNMSKEGLIMGQAMGSYDELGKSMISGIVSGQVSMFMYGLVSIYFLFMCIF